MLFGQFRDASGSEPSRHAARDGLVSLHLPLVEHCARRFRNRGEPFEDLVQVGTIGLIKSIDRFELDRGVEFSTYATPTIIGEIKRHFRDKGWAIRVPRRLQELRMQISGDHRGAHPDARPLTDPAGARRGDRLLGGGDRRGHRVEQRLLHAQPRRDRRRRRRRRRLDAGDDGPRRRGARADRDPGVDQAAARGPAQPREADPAAALLQEQDAVGDRRRDRGQPDARLPAAEPNPRPAARVAPGDRSERGRTCRYVVWSRWSESASMLAGWSRPTSTTTATQPGPPRPRSCSPPRKFQASPRAITWATTIGLRAQARPRTTYQRAGHEQQPPSSDEEHGVVTPIAARSAWMSAATEHAVRQHQQSPSSAARLAATTRGGGGSGRRRRARSPQYDSPIGVPVGGPRSTHVRACDKTDQPKGLSPDAILATVEGALVNVFTSGAPRRCYPCESEFCESHGLARPLCLPR